MGRLFPLRRIVCGCSFRERSVRKASIKQVRRALL